MLDFGKSQIERKKMQSPKGFPVAAATETVSESISLTQLSPELARQNFHALFQALLTCTHANHRNHVKTALSDHNPRAHPHARERESV